jgi:hypothetical protein
MKTIILSFLSKIACGRFSLKGKFSLINTSNTFEELIDEHFIMINSMEHPCRESLTLALNKFKKNFEGKSNILMIETGSAAWGTFSTVLFDKIANKLGAKLETVDIRINPLLNLRKKVSSSTTLNVDDSVSFLKKINSEKKCVAFLYLDSWDVDWKNPESSAEHGKNEFLAILPSLVKGSIVLIDDTPKNIDILREISVVAAEQYNNNKGCQTDMGGKGKLIHKIVIERELGKVLFHQYQLLIEIC